MPPSTLTPEPAVSAAPSSADRDGDSAPDARGASDTPSGNERRCIVTRTAAPREGLIRFVVGPDNALIPDLAENLPGRGLWVTASGEALATKGLAKAAARSARQKVTVDPDMVGLLDRLLTTRCQSLLGLARRSGAVESGFDKVRDHVVSAQAHLMLTASDSDGRDGQELARRVQALSHPVRVSRALTAAELGRALGKERQVHVSVARGSLADRLCRDLDRLMGIRGANPATNEDFTPPEQAGHTVRNEAPGR